MQISGRVTYDDDDIALVFLGNLRSAVIERDLARVQVGTLASTHTTDLHRRHEATLRAAGIGTPLA